MSVSVRVCVRQTADANDGTSVKVDRLTKSTVQSPCIFYTESLRVSRSTRWASAHVRGHFFIISLSLDAHRTLATLSQKVLHMYRFNEKS